MAGLCWMAVTLAFFLSAENTLAVEQKRLAKFVSGVFREYGAEGMFSLAVSIPEDQNQEAEDILNKVYESDPRYEVFKKFNRNEVYVGNRVVAAKVLKRDTGADHAEARVVGRLNDLFKPNNKNDLLLFYAYASPCVKKCTSRTHPERILRSIIKLKKWRSHAFVFSKIFKPRTGRPITEKELRGALERLGSEIGLNKIFRCDIKAGRMQCTSCYSDNQVTPACVSDNDSQPGPSRSQPQQGRYSGGRSRDTGGRYSGGRSRDTGGRYSGGRSRDTGGRYSGGRSRDTGGQI